MALVTAVSTAGSLASSGGSGKQLTVVAVGVAVGCCAKTTGKKAESVKTSVAVAVGVVVVTGMAIINE